MKNTPINLFIIGDSQVGKTSILNTINGVGFDENLTRTVGIDFCYIDFKLDNGTKIKLKIYDTSGQEQYHSLSMNVLRQSNGIILVFSKDSIDSFKNIKDIWMENLNQCINLEDIPLILVENKNDIEDSDITEEDILKLVDEYKLDFIKVSAKNNENIDTMFKKLTMKILEKNNDKKNKDKKNKNKKNKDKENTLPVESDDSKRNTIKITKENNKIEKKKKHCC